MHLYTAKGLQVTTLFFMKIWSGHLCGLKWSPHLCGLCRTLFVFFLELERYCLREAGFKKKSTCSYWKQHFMDHTAQKKVIHWYTGPILKHICVSCNFVITLSLRLLCCVGNLANLMFLLKNDLFVVSRTYGTQSLPWSMSTQVLWFGSTLCGQPWDWPRGVQVLGPLQTTL